MNNKKDKQNNKSKTQLGLFLFFLSGLFVLQIVFAFTIHGDIGPRTDIIPGIEKPASPILIGKVDSIIDQSFKVARVAPEGAFAPASRNLVSNSVQASAHIDAKTTSAMEAENNTLQSTDIDRFAEYRVKKGDTLQKISRKLYGNANMVQPIVRINRISSERSLKLGSTLKVPRTGLVASVKIAEQ